MRNQRFLKSQSSICSLYALYQLAEITLLSIFSYTIKNNGDQWCHHSAKNCGTLKMQRNLDGLVRIFRFTARRRNNIYTYVYCILPYNNYTNNKKSSVFKRLNLATFTLHFQNFSTIYKTQIIGTKSLNSTPITSST